MVFDFVVRTPLVVALGIATYALLVAQMLIGLRKIRFKGRTHQLVHRRVAWTLLATGTVHAFLGIVYGLGLRIG